MVSTRFTRQVVLSCVSDILNEDKAFIEPQFQSGHDPKSQESKEQSKTGPPLMILSVHQNGLKEATSFQELSEFILESCHYSPFKIPVPVNI